MNSVKNYHMSSKARWLMIQKLVKTNITSKISNCNESCVVHIKSTREKIYDFDKMISRYFKGKQTISAYFLISPLHRLNPYVQYNMILCLFYLVKLNFEPQQNTRTLNIRSVSYFSVKNRKM